MARTTATRRLRHHSFYAASPTTTQQIQAHVPPTKRQYQCAFDYHDETTILSYLRLASSIERHMDATNAYITQHHRSPPGFSSINHRTDTDNDPYAWFWPYRWCRLTQPVTVFAFAAEYGFADVISWFFCDRERVARMSATLVLVFQDTLSAATAGVRPHIVEMLLRSPVYLEALTDEQRQWALDKALRRARSNAMCHLLVAHGASVDSFSETIEPSWACLWYREFTAGPAVEKMKHALWCGDTNAVERGMLEAVVVDHEVLDWAVWSGNPEAVRMLLSRGFVDLDARTRDGFTAFLSGAAARDRYEDSELRERRQEVLRSLLDGGVDATLRDPRGRTALHMAIMNSSLSSVEFLLDRLVATSGVGAVHDDTTALAMAFEQRAREGDHSERVLAALLERGACARAHAELVATGRESAACASPNRCLRDLKRKRGDGEETDEVRVKQEAVLE